MMLEVVRLPDNLQMEFTDNMVALHCSERLRQYELEEAPGD
jgi:hypothetical protein